MGRWRRGTHDVGAQRAEGAGAAGEQVGAVERLEDLDVVLTVALGKEGGGCQDQASHQGAPPSPSRSQTQDQCWGEASGNTGEFGSRSLLGPSRPTAMSVCVCRGTLGLSYFCAWLPWAVLAPEGPLQTLSRKHCPSPELEESLSPKPWAAPAPAPAPTDSLRVDRPAPAARLLPAPCCFRQGHLRLLCCGAPGLTASPDSPSLTPSLPALPHQELGAPSSKYPGDPTGPTLAWVPFTSCPSLVSFPAVHGGQSGPLKTHTRPGRSSARPLSAPPHR